MCVSVELFHNGSIWSLLAIVFGVIFVVLVVIPMRFCLCVLKVIAFVYFERDRRIVSKVNPQRVLGRIEVFLRNGCSTDSIIISSVSETLVVLLHSSQKEPRPLTNVSLFCFCPIGGFWHEEAGVVPPFWTASLCANLKCSAQANRLNRLE